MNKVGELYDGLFSLLFANKSEALHYGFWGKGIRSFASAQECENSSLSESLHILPGQRVLDAGCGVGGSAFWLATHCGAQVEGIALGKKEIAHANSLAKKKGLERQVHFTVANFSSTHFADNCFDVIWAVESLLYEENKAKTLREWHRLLSPGGSVVIADLFLDHELTKEGDTALLKKFSGASCTAPLITTEAMKSILSAAGFTEITKEDQKHQVMRTSWLYMLNGALLYPVCLIFKLFTFGRYPVWLLDNSFASIMQWRGLHSGLFTYAVIIARKRR